MREIIEKYKWKKRVIYIQAHKEDSDYQKLLKILKIKAVKKKVKERKIHFVVNLKKDALFYYHLFGLDGDVKDEGYRMNMRNIFALIDEMPMRKAELEGLI